MLSFLSCKNNKTQPTDLEDNTIETNVVQEDIDTISAIDTLQIKEDDIKENIITEEVTKPIEKEVEKVTEKVNKTSTKIIEEETVIKEIVEEKNRISRKDSLVGTSFNHTILSPLDSFEKFFDENSYDENNQQLVFFDHTPSAASWNWTFEKLGNRKNYRKK